MNHLQQFKNHDIGKAFSDDSGLKSTLQHLLSPAEFDRLNAVLKKWESNLPKWNALANEASRPEKLPRLEKFTSTGLLREEVILPLETKTIRREVVEQGVFTSSTEVEKFAKIYLLGQLGESGVTCPLACTDGLIRSISALGSDFLKKEYLPRLSSGEFPLAGAQFITEQTGGSDVGAIEGKAIAQADGSFLIHAEKWYCSACDEFFLVGARADPQGGDSRPRSTAGTQGIAIFFVPRTVNGQINNLSYRRLKDKLGTQSLPTAEIDFKGSKAWVIGDVENGFHHLMNYVLNASRIHNAANGLAIARRSFAEARNYADQRVAFGKSIIEYPLVQEYLISILAHIRAKSTLYFHLLQTIDEGEFLPADKNKQLWQRYLINLMKYRTAYSMTEKVKEGILVFGANGIIQDFSIMPRLLRDALILETWEGTHNTLCLQIVRDASRFDFFERLQNEIQTLLKNWPDDILANSKKSFLTAWSGFQKTLLTLDLKDPQVFQTHARRIVDSTADFLEIPHLVKTGVAQKDNTALLLASFLCLQSFENRQAMFNHPFYRELKLFARPLIAEKEIDIDLKEF